MAQIKLDPYLYFKGNCKEAMEFYKSIFGGELEVQTYADTPPSEIPSGIDKNWAMHAKLEGGAIKLFASDTLKASDAAAKIDLALSGDDEAQLRKIFDGLSEGGSVFMPITKMFWGDLFGSVTDKYKVNWMVNITQPATS